MQHVFWDLYSGLVLDGIVDHLLAGLGRAPVDDHLCCAYSTFHLRSLVGCCEIRMTVQSKVILYSGATCILTTNDTRAMFLTL